MYFFFQAEDGIRDRVRSRGLGDVYKRQTLVETNKIIYEPNPYFREPDKPYFSRIELKGGGTVNEAARAVLQAGDVDYAANLQINFQEEPDLASGSKGQILAPFGAFVERILLNRTDPNRETDDGERSSIQFPHPFFSDLRVRQAFAHAIDREAIAKLYGPTGQPTTNVLVSPPPYASPNTENLYPFDLAKAASLLDEAGWTDTNNDGIRDNGKIRKAGDPLVTMRVLLQTSASPIRQQTQETVSYTHLRAHETVLDLVCRLLLEKKTDTHSTKHHNHKPTRKTIHNDNTTAYTVTNEN